MEEDVPPEDKIVLVARRDQRNRYPRINRGQVFEVVKEIPFPESSDDDSAEDDSAAEESSSKFIYQILVPGSINNNYVWYGPRYNVYPSQMQGSDPHFTLWEEAEQKFRWRVYDAVTAMFQPDDENIVDLLFELLFHGGLE